MSTDHVIGDNISKAWRMCGAIAVDLVRPDVSAAQTSSLSDNIVRSFP